MFAPQVRARYLTMRAEVTQVANATTWDDLPNTDLLFRIPSIWKNTTLLSSIEVSSLAQQLESVKVCLVTELLIHPQMNCSQMHPFEWL